jgi:hypothetical protein
MRRILISAAAVLLGALGFVAFAPSADALPFVCLHIGLNINGTPVDQAVCVPDGVPGLPTDPIPV